MINSSYKEIVKGSSIFKLRKTGSNLIAENVKLGSYQTDRKVTAVYRVRCMYMVG
jgi:hypothetical protein